MGLQVREDRGEVHVYLARVELEGGPGGQGVGGLKRAEEEVEAVAEGVQGEAEGVEGAREVLRGGGVVLVHCRCGESWWVGIVWICCSGSVSASIEVAAREVCVSVSRGTDRAEAASDV